jgi:pilus assembly protein Flp/PilA
VIAAVLLSRLIVAVTALVPDDRDEDGQGLAEYALILALIAMVAIAALLFMGGALSDKLSAIGESIESVAP